MIGSDTVLYTVNGLITFGCKWLDHLSSNNIHYFPAGQRYKDIRWKAQLAAGNGHFCIMDTKDYIYISKLASITHCPDYYNVRALSYIDIVAEVIRLTEMK